MGRRCQFESLESRRLLSTYFVSTSGSNSAAGTSTGAAWRTLQYAADRVVAGDTVIVAPGSYVGFDLRRSGTSSQRITFRGQSGTVINQVNPVTNRDGINLERASYITIEGFTLIGSGDPATSRAGIRVVGDGDDEGIFSTGVIVRNNRADRWGYWGMLTGFTDDILIENNEFSRSAREHGLYFSNSGDRPIIRNNISWGNANCGIHMNGDIFTGNTDLPAVDGIISGALVEGNRVYGNGAGGEFSSGGGSAINCDGVRNSRIQNNLLYDNHATGIALYQIDGGGPSIGNVVANNTVINAADGRWCLLLTDGATGTTVFNNIFFNLHSSRGAIELSGDSAAGLKSDYNLTNDRFSHNDTFVSLAQWRSLTGGDAHSTAITLAQMQALFSNYAGNDFSLSPTSAAVDKGTSGLVNGSLRSAPTIDLNRASRPSGAGWDIGAFERDATPIASIEDGKLLIRGSITADIISVIRTGNDYTVSRNGSAMNFPAGDVTSIEIYGYDGNDTITVGAGVIGTYINGGIGNDLLRGGDDRDTLAGAAGKDTIYGGAGDDVISGHQSPDRLYGEGGKDRLYGGDGDDLLDGGSHYDRFWPDAGINTCYGQGGDDYFYARNAATDQLFGGSGVDRAQIDPILDTLSAIEQLLA